MPNIEHPLPNTYNVPKDKDLLLNYQSSVDYCAYFEHEFGRYSLEARLLYNKNGERPWVLSVHGARSDYTKSDAVTVALRDHGFSILGFNMTGHSIASNIPAEETTLGNNIEEADAFYSYLDPDRPKSIIAHSIGATPALKTLGKHLDTTDKLVLFGPSIYTQSAYNIRFGPEFRQSISAPFSYRDSDVLDILRSFQGKLLMIKGQFDGLNPTEFGRHAGTSAGEVYIRGKNRYSPIPEEVIELLYNSVPENRRNMIVIDDCDHGVVPWIANHPAEGAAIIKTIADFLKS